MRRLPQIVIDTFHDDLAMAQRGWPERAMQIAQDVLPGGGLSYAIEHGGDITNRGWKNFHITSPGTSLDYVRNKTRTVLSGLRNPMYFRRDHMDSMRKFAQRDQIPWRQLMEEHDRVLMQYADAHRALPVFNRMQWVAREVAIALGEQRFEDARKMLKILQANTDAGLQHWINVATRYTPGPGGKPLVLG